MNKLFIIVVVAFFALEISAQTFQYSRGWTNGKRSNGGATEMPPFRQMMPSPLVQVLTANDLNSRERLIQHIIKNPCDLRSALMSHNFKLSEDFNASPADGYDEEAANRFKRDIMNH